MANATVKDRAAQELAPAETAHIERHFESLGEKMITAEVIPKPDKAHYAASALQEAGFRVISIGPSITIGGELSLFEETFSTKLDKVSKDIFPSVPGTAEREYYRVRQPLLIPDELKDLIEDIYFPEPPEFY